ncbi:MAG: type II toxin-antitoxin system Phd/YefM family antitoxin [Thiomicrospira sp.]|nr:type II toxin-antitoxin system Phd/YefM family antitoxin [Thiomicrospira sp.]
MESLSFSEVRTHLAQALQQVEMTGKPIAITKHGKPCAVLEPFDRNRVGFMNALEQWRANSQADNADEAFESVRTEDKGREFSW